MSMPMTVDMAYDIEEVNTADEGAAPLGVAGGVDRLARMGNATGETAWKGSVRTRRRSGRPIGYVLPEDRGWLDTSPYLPAPAWDPADAGFATPAELADLQGILDAIPVPARTAPSATFAWGLGRPAWSATTAWKGCRRARAARSVSAWAASRCPRRSPRGSAARTARRGPLSLAHEVALGRSAFGLSRASPHGAVRAGSSSATRPRPVVRARRRRYYQATGAALDWSPASAERAYRVRAYAERQAGVARNTRITLLDWDAGFRDQPTAAPGDQVGLEATLTPWWGRDPSSAGVGLELQFQGERGDFDFERARVGARALLPMPAHVRMAVEVGGAPPGGRPRVSVRRDWAGPLRCGASRRACSWAARS